MSSSEIDKLNSIIDSLETKLASLSKLSEENVGRKKIQEMSSKVEDSNPYRFLISKKNLQLIEI